MFAALAARRLEVCKYLLNYSNPPFDLSLQDEEGLSVLHSAIFSGDLKIAHAVIKAINSGTPERRAQLNINSRCHRQGWAPLHYAIEKIDVEAVKLLLQCGANPNVTIATDVKRQTPLDFAKLKLKQSNNATKPSVQAVIDALIAGVENAKIAKKLENSTANNASKESCKEIASASAKDNGVSGPVAGVEK